MGKSIEVPFLSHTVYINFPFPLSIYNFVLLRKDRKRFMAGAISEHKINEHTLAAGSRWVSLKRWNLMGKRERRGERRGGKERKGVFLFEPLNTRLCRRTTLVPWHACWSAYSRRPMMHAHCIEDTDKIPLPRTCPGHIPLGQNLLDKPRSSKSLLGQPTEDYY